MGGTKRKILKLPKLDQHDEEEVFEPVEEAVTALEDIASLQARLDSALDEIDALKRRAFSQKPSPVMPRSKFVTSLARRFGQGVEVNGCVVRIAVSNFDETRETHGDEAAEELCTSVGSWLGGHVRSTDLVGRIGSCTFAIFFGFADRRGVEEKMGRLMKRVEHAPVTWCDTTLFPKLNFEFEELRSDTAQSGEVSHAEAC